MKQFVLALCGLPAAGKSVLADAIQKALNYDVEIVKTDEWRNNEYYTDWKPEKEKPVRKKAVERVRKLVAEGKSVIHDDTNYYTSMRHELLEVALENNCGFAIIHVTTPLATALQWNGDRGDSPLPDKVIEDIFEKFDIPGRRYLWDNAELEVNMETQEIYEVIPEILDILEALEPAVKPKPSLVTSNEFNRLDTETRKVVSEFLQEHPEHRGNREVSVVRRGVLQKCIEEKIPVKGVRELLWDTLLKIE
jgi:O-phosphoseryl-tRNA(Sec) kinase